jgi:hypothetical protein
MVKMRRLITIRGRITDLLVSKIEYDLSSVFKQLISNFTNQVFLKSSMNNVNL